MSDDKRLYADGGSGSLGSNSAANDASAGSVPARPRTASGRASAAPQDTMEFIALASRGREQAAGAASDGRAASAAGTAATQGSRFASQQPGQNAAGAAQHAAARNIPRIDTEDIPRMSADAPRTQPATDYRTGGAATAPTSQAASSQASSAGASGDDFYDFNLPYGSDDGNDDGLIRHRHSKKRRRKRHIIIAVVAVLVVLVVGLGVSGFMLFNSARNVKSQASTALTLVTGMKDKVASGDFAALSDDAQQIDSLCATIQDETSGPLWTAATFIPVVGGDVTAARTLVDTLADVSSQVLVPVSANLADATPGKLLSDGTINVSAIEAIATSLADSAPVLTEANERVQSIGDTHIGQVTELVDTAKDGFAMLSGAVDASQKIAPVLPAMLGAQGTRQYLIVAENNAEIRTLGGFSGALGVLTVDNGHISLDEFEGVSTLRQLGGPTDQIQISDEEMRLFQPEAETLNFTIGDAFFIPDFPRGSEITRTLWGLTHEGQQIDGVFAIDPIFLQYVLQLVGGVTALDGTQVDGTNAAQVLLSEVYWKYATDTDMQDAVFASVASAAFDKVVGGMGSLDFVQLFDVIGRGAEEGRLLIWMENESEQEAIRQVGVDGALPTDPADPETGVYVNNYSYSKIDWYLDLNVECSSGMKSGDGTTTYSMKATLTNTLPAELADELPPYLQAHHAGLEPAMELLRLYLYAPMGGTISDVQCSADSMTEATHNGLQVFYQDVYLMPGDTYEVTYTVTVPPEGADKELDVRVTPTAQDARKGTLDEED